MPTRVVNSRLHHGTVYIGRPSKWGNPYSHQTTALAKRVATRAEAIRLYEPWIIGCPTLLAEVHTLRGQILECWCKPLACHGDFLAMLADSCCVVCNMPTYGQSAVGDEFDGEDRWWHVGCAPRSMLITDKDHYP
jgi:uncharacterized protein DUF4326